MSQYASFRSGADYPTSCSSPARSGFLISTEKARGKPDRIRAADASTARILSVTGLSGLATGRCTVMFDRESVTLMVGTASNQVRLWRVPTE